MAGLYGRTFGKVHAYVSLRRREGRSGGDDTVTDVPILVTGRGKARRRPRRGKWLFHGTIVLGALGAFGLTILLFATVPVIAIVALEVACLLGFLLAYRMARSPMIGPGFRRRGKPIE